MKKYYYLIILLSLYSCKTKTRRGKTKKSANKKTEEAKPVKVEQNFYTSFKGEIDNEEAFMFLQTQGKLSGGYYYSFQVNEFFDLKGTIDSLGNIELTEQENKIEIAKWTGIFKDKETIKLERVLFEDKAKCLLHLILKVTFL